MPLNASRSMPVVGKRKSALFASDNITYLTITSAGQLCPFLNCVCVFVKKMSVSNYKIIEINPKFLYTENLHVNVYTSSFIIAKG